jgi:transglutaminase-like putative cysteine protease
MLLLISVHQSRAADLLTSGVIDISPAVPSHAYRDSFGNTCTRLFAPPGRLTVSTRFDIQDTGLPDDVNWYARQHAVQDLPDDTILYLLGSRYCETDRLSDTAWSLFGGTEPGWARVQAICDFVHRHIRFDYQLARPTRTAAEAYQEGVGVCRDFAHLAVTFCRCMNIPARYCTGYLGDIGVPPMDAPGDFSAWMEVFLEGRWYTFDARHNTPRIGRILMARGRDATDVAIANSFGSAPLASFFVFTDQVPD